MSAVGRPKGARSVHNVSASRPSRSKGVWYERGHYDGPKDDLDQRRIEAYKRRFLSDMKEFVAGLD